MCKDCNHYVENPNMPKKLIPIIPIFKEDRKHLFASQYVKPYEVVFHGHSILTCPFITEKRFDLLGVSQNNEMLVEGLIDVTDIIGKDVKLKAIYLAFKSSDGPDDVVKFDLTHMSTTEYNLDPDKTRLLSLNFISDSLTIDRSTKQYDGSDLVILADIVKCNYSVRLSIRLIGQINTETGDCIVQVDRLYDHSVEDLNDQDIDNELNEENSVGDGLVPLMYILENNAKCIGYDLEAYRISGK